MTGVASACSLSDVTVLSPASAVLSSPPVQSPAYSRVSSTNSPSARRLRRQGGFAYLAMMFSIVLIGITLTAAAKPWKMVMQREREADLLAYGIEIQQAIGAYSAKMKAGRVVPGEVYPPSLEELTRQPSPLLRKVYRDPLTQGALVVVRAPTGGVMGVRSRSVATPIRQREFPDAVRHFDNLKSYKDWVFQHPNASGSTFPQAGLGGQVAAGGMGAGASAGTLPTGMYPSSAYPGGPSGVGQPSAAGPRGNNLNLPGFQSTPTPDSAAP